MYPTLFNVGAIGLHTYGLMIMAGIAAGFGVMGHRAGKVGINPDRLMPFYMLTIFGGLFGARLFHFLFAQTELFFSNPLSFFDPDEGGLVFYGAAVTATVLGLGYARWAHIKPWKLGDVAAPSLMLGLALGRMGCFFAGCCHGAACPIPEKSQILALPGGAIVSTEGFPFMALTFKSGVGVGAIFDTPTYPTQLWESTGALLLFLGLSWMWKHARKFDGQILAALLLTYPVLRSTIEQYRGDTIRGTDWFGLFSTSQLISIGVLLSGVAIGLLRVGKGVAHEEPIEHEDPFADEE